MSGGHTSLTVLGLNSAGFNTSAALIRDGVPLFAAEEERLIREKRTRRFPMATLRAALASGGVGIGEVDAVAIAWNPGVNLEAFNAAQSARARYLGEILYNVPNYLLTLTPGVSVTGMVQEATLADGNSLRVHFIDHHLAHASAFLYSPFEEAAILTLDAFGEKDCLTFSRGIGGRIEPLWSQEFPHSLGSFYSTFTEYCGFQPQGDEWKLMGAAPYGNPAVFLDKVRALIRLRPERGFELDLACFNHYQFHRPHYYSPRMAEHLGLPPNPVGCEPTQVHYDLAAAAQQVFEETYFAVMEQLRATTGLGRLVVSGGVAMNSVANGKIFGRTGFADAFIPPTPDDSGGSLGAALYVHCNRLGGERCYTMRDNYLGPGYDDAAIAATLAKYRLRARRLEDPAREAAEAIAAGQIIGWFQGRLEFGDRALGNRSILADPRDGAMKEKVNATIKYRESFRPFAPAILADSADKFFVDARSTPFMEKVFPIRAERRGEIPAVTHVDGSGRLQTVTAQQNPLFHRLITAFDAITGVPVVMNTSFNLKGEAMVCSPDDAIRTFYTSGLDALFLGSFLLEK